MPWNEVKPMDEKVCFIADYLRQHNTMVELSNTDKGRCLIWHRSPLQTETGQLSRLSQHERQCGYAKPSNNLYLSIDYTLSGILLGSMLDLA